MRGQFQVHPDAEITIECAPGQISDDTLAVFQTVGVNRVSLGVQSFIDREAQTTAVCTPAPSLKKTLPACANPASPTSTST